MPVKQVDNSQFVFIIYDRENMMDFYQLKQLLETAAGDKLFAKDIVIDFTACAPIMVTEINLLSTFLKSLQGSNRLLQLISTPELTKKIKSMNLDRIKNLKIFDNRHSFLDRISNPGDTQNHTLLPQL